MNMQIESSWKTILSDEFEKPYFKQLTKFVSLEFSNETIYPPPSQIFNAFDICTYDNTRVVILGQDPYHGPGQANGLCFSVAPNIRIPPSLQNIYKEILDDVGGAKPQSGDLTHWAKQGVLLLNATLTVQAHNAGSHQNKGWETFTDSVVTNLANNKTGLVFLLWGSYAKRKGQMIDREKHLVLEAPHPSPLSSYRGFFGCKHFSKTNDYLLSKSQPPITWTQN
jgi:uracil-DNA glycosylase